MQGQESEIALWQAFKSGDKEAYADLYRMYHPRLYNYGRKFTSEKEMVEDGIQEIFVHFWMHRNKLTEVQNLHSYLFVSFRRHIFKMLQRAHKHSIAIESEDYPAFTLEASVDQVMINNESIYERHINLKTAVGKLTERQKEAIFFMYYENMSYEAIAQILNISKKATYKLVARAITELRSVYKQNAVLWMIPVVVFMSHIIFF